MKLLLVVLLSFSFVYAENLTLRNIITYVRVHHPNYKAMEEESLALGAKIRAENARELSTLSFNGANADPNNGDSAFEYGVGVSTIVDLANVRGLNLASADLQNEATLLLKQRELFAFGNGLRELYHQSCLDKEKLLVLQSTLEAFNRLYAKKEKAYKYQEISKKELLQLRLEKKLLEQKVRSQTREYEISREALLNLTAMPHVGESELVCRDLYPIVERVNMENKPFLLTALAFEKRMRSLDRKKERFRRGLEPIELSLGYDNEIDTKRIGAGFSVPLGFTSERNEQSRIYLLHEKEMRKLRHHAWLLNQNSKLRKIEAQLQNDYHRIEALRENIETYRKELMPLVEKSFQMGESSVIEYILARQKLLTISSELIETKKRYYSELFTLYTLIETEK